MDLKEREKHEQNMLYWILPILLGLVAFAFAASISELLKFVFPNLKLHFYMGFFASMLTFIGYFSTAHREDPSKKRSLIPEIFALVFLSKLYTFFALPWNEFITHIRLKSFFEANFSFAFVILYFVWRLAREAGKLVDTLNFTYVERELKRQQDEYYLKDSNVENITGKKLVRILFVPMLLVLIGVIVSEQSFQERMQVANSLRLSINLLGGLLAASTIAVATMMLYLNKSNEWASEKAQVDNELGIKWVTWALLFVMLFTLFASVLPDDLSPVYLYVPDALKAILPFMHRDMEEVRSPITARDKPEKPEIGEEEPLIVKNYYWLYVVITTTIRLALFLLILGVVLYNLFRVLRENADDLPSALKKIISSIIYFFEMIKSLFGKVYPTKRLQVKVTEQIQELFRRNKVSHHQMNINEIRKLYLELLVEAEQKGITREAYKTAQEFGFVLEEMFPERFEEINELTLMYQDARYNKDPDETTSTKAKGVFKRVLSVIRDYSKRKEQSS